MNDLANGAIAAKVIIATVRTLSSVTTMLELPTGLILLPRIMQGDRVVVRALFLAGRDRYFPYRAVTWQELKEIHYPVATLQLDLASYQGTSRKSLHLIERANNLITLAQLQGQRLA